MIRKTNLGIAAALALAITVFAGPAVRADNPNKHDSNTLHKIGKAIQYTTRKDTENLSIDTHRAEHRKSVESMRPQRATAVVTPNGKQFVVSHRGRAGHMYAYRHHAYKHGHYTHYYK
jgi:hypothetical protein